MSTSGLISPHNSIERSLQQYRLQADKDTFDLVGFREFLNDHINDLTSSGLAKPVKEICKEIEKNLLRRSETLDEVKEIAKRLIQGSPAKSERRTISTDDFSADASDPLSSDEEMKRQKIEEIKRESWIKDLINRFSFRKGTVEEYIEQNKGEFRALEDPKDNWGPNLDDFTMLPENWQLHLRFLEATKDPFHKELLFSSICEHTKQYYDQNPKSSLENISKLSSIVNKRYAELLNKSASNVIVYSNLTKESEHQELLGLLAFGVDLAPMLDQYGISNVWPEALKIWIKGIPPGGLPLAEVLKSKLSEIEKTVEEMKRKKSGHIWECTKIVREKDGLIYGFQIKRKFANPSVLERKNQEIYPALEPSSIPDVLRKIPGVPSISDEMIGKLKMLGFFFTDENSNDDRPTLWLPDIETLRSRLKMLECKILIVTSSGIAGDEEFSRKHLKGHFLISSGKEFIHDLIFHAIPALMKYFKMHIKVESEFDYSEIRAWMLVHIEHTIGVIERMKEQLGELKWKDCVLTPKHIDLFWAVLSGWIDAHTNKWVDILGSCRLAQRSWAQMVGIFERGYPHFGPEAKGKYGPLEDKDFEELKGLWAAYCDGLDKVAPAAPVVRRKGRRPARRGKAASAQRKAERLRAKIRWAKANKGK